MATMGPDLVVPVFSEDDVVTARQEARGIAEQLGMSPSLQTAVATAVSELARNIVAYAGRGEISLSVVDGGPQDGLEVVARDQGPGIKDVELALQDGYSTGGSLGLGLPGARRLMDEFEVRSEPEAGTTVTMRKWAPA